MPDAARSRTLLLLLLGLTVGCQEPVSEADGDPTGPIWVVEDTPSLSIGALEGDEEELFDAVADVALVADSVLAVLDSGWNRVRYYDLDGRLIETVGGTGQGPGELERIQGSWVDARGRLGVIDEGQRRVTLYGPDGSFQDRPFPPDPTEPHEPLHLVGLQDGVWVAFKEILQPELPEGRSQLSRYARLLDDEEGVFVNQEAVELPATYWYATPDGEGIRLPLSLSPRPRAEVRGNVAVVLDPDGTRVLVLGPERQWRELALQGRCPPVPDVYFEAGEAGDERREGIDRHVFQDVAPDCLPPYDHLSVTRDGRIWVRLTSSQEDDSESLDHWKVLEAAEGVVGRARLPEGFIPMAARDDVLFGRWIDSVGVHHVRGYRIAQE